MKSAKCLYRISRGVLIIVLCLVPFHDAAFAGHAHTYSRSHILILNSYHPRYHWTDQIVSAVTESFSETLPRENIHIEYMDSRKREAPSYFDMLYQLYRYKYQAAENKFDVVITSDDNAFDFLARYRRDLFPEAPVVFCGINFFDPQADVQDRWYTGIVESDAISANLDLIQSIHPDVERIVILGDQTRLGQSLSSVARKVIRNRGDGGPQLDLWDNYSLDTLYAEVQTFSAGTVVFLNILQVDKDGAYFSYTDDLPHLSRLCPVPIYGQWGVELGNGVVGGMMNDAKRHGSNAAKLAKEILHGKAPFEIPIQKAAYEPEFDYNLLQRFNIKPSRLPSGAVVINEPAGFYEVNKKVIWTASIIIASLAIIVVVLLANVRRRLHSESALRRSEEKYRRLFMEDLTGDFITDADGRLVDCNPSFARILGFRSTIEPLGYPMEKLFAKVEDYHTCMSLLSHQDAVSDYEVALAGKDGRQLSVIANINAGRNAGGEIDEIKGYLFDITERKMLEKQLLQSQKLEALGRLAGGVAHDFNNLITAIIGYSEMALMKLPEGDEHRKAFEIIYDAGTRASDLTRQLLAFSRRQVLEFQVVDVGRVAENMSRIISSLIGDDVALDMQIDPGAGAVNADPVQIEQVLLNLSVNAKEAMPHGGTLIIRTRRLHLDEAYARIYGGLAPGDYVLLTVADTGKGMAAEVREHAFEPFYTTKESGTGLGLATIHGIVKQHHGAIFIYSEPGSGTTVKIYLPVVDDAAVREAPVHVESLTRGTETVLVVDDDDAVRGLVCDILASSGYVVLDAPEGERALQIGNETEGAIDLLIADVEMPKMNGQELAKKFREIHPETRVLFMSGYSDIAAADEEAPRETAFISKPLAPGKLTARIRDFLDNS